MRRLSTRAAGMLILILGIWGGLAPFIGSYFHFALGPNHSWTWTSGRFWLSVLPGAVAAIGGLMLLGAGPRPSGKLGALLALAAGIWFAIGPEVSLLWNAAGAQGAAHGSKGIRVLEMLTYHTLLGAVIAALAGYALPGLATRRTAEEVAAERPEPIRDEPVGREPVVADSARRDSVRRGSVRHEPLVAESARDEPVRDEPVRHEPVGDEPVREAPVRDEPLREEPVGDASRSAEAPVGHDPAPGAASEDRTEAHTAVIDRPTTEQAASPTTTTGDGADPAPQAAPASVTMRRRRGGLLSRLRG